MIFNCTICDEPTVEEVSAILYCGHMFHKYCIKNFQQCPTCKHDISKPLESMEMVDDDHEDGGWSCIEDVDITQDDGVNIGDIGLGQDVYATLYPNNRVVISRLFKLMNNLSIN